MLARCLLAAVLTAGANFMRNSYTTTLLPYKIGTILLAVVSSSIALSRLYPPSPLHRRRHELRLCRQRIRAGRAAAGISRLLSPVACSMQHSSRGQAACFASIFHVRW